MIAANRSRGSGALASLLLGIAACGPPPQANEPGPDETDPLVSVDAQELYDRGVELAGRGDLVRAEQYIAAAVQRGYPEADALPLLLQVCVSSSRMGAALSYAEPYLERHPSDWALRFLVANIRYGLGDVADARAELERVIADAPDHPAAYFTLGVVLRDGAADPQAARPYFQRYLELAPDGDHAAEAQAAVDPPRRVQLGPREVAPTQDEGAGGPAIERVLHGSPVAEPVEQTEGQVP